MARQDLKRARRLREAVCQLARGSGRSPGCPRSPADPAYSFSWLDESIRDATARGLSVLIGVQSAPAFAEGPNRPPSVLPGTWKPRPAAVGDFMTALARRYSGGFAGLPRVRDFQLWNEQNLSTFLTPQWRKNKLVAPSHYRKMLNAAYDAVHQVRKSNRLVAGGTAPYGDNRGGSRSRPLHFWRNLLCLRGRKRLRPRKCPKQRQRAHFDVMARHPINASGPPSRGALHPDDASSADLGAGGGGSFVRPSGPKRVLPRGRRPLWATEFWWESDPPDSQQGYPLRKHARYIQESLYLFWKGGASLAGSDSRIRDGDHSADPSGRVATGAYFFNGRPKPALTAYRFPFVVERKNRRKVRLWGKSPRRGKVRIERKRGNDWKRVIALEAGNNRIFTKVINLNGTRS